MPNDEYFLAYNGFTKLPETSNLLDGERYQIVAWDTTNGEYTKSEIQYLTASDVVVVTQASDLTGELQSNVLYRIAGTIDMGSESITVPEGGLSISGPNGGRDIAVLTSSADNYTMFVSPEGSYSGNFIADNCSFHVTGTNSQIFNLDNNGNSSAIDISTVNFGIGVSDKTTSLGSLSSYRQLFMTACGYFVDDGLTFSGTWTGITITDSIVLNFPTATFLKEGTSLSINNIRSNLNFLFVNTSSVFCNFDENNISSNAGLFLEGFRSGASDALPNIAGSSVKSRFRDCVGIRNTYIGGQWSITSTAETVISSANTPVKVAGTTTYADLQWFSGDNSNEFVYISDQNIEIEIKCVLSLSGGSNDQFNVIIRKYDASATSYVNLSESGSRTLNAAGRAEGIATFAFANMDENDRIEIWIENQTDTSNITALASGLVAITERSS